VRVLNLVPTADSVAYSQQVRALAARGVDCDTVSPPHAHVPGERSRSPLDYLRFYPRVLRASAGGHDVVHANQGVVAPLALAQPARPVVVSLWGTDLFGRLGPVSRWCARRADATVVMSDRMADELDGEARVVPHGVDLDLFRPLDRGGARRAVDWDADGHDVLFPYAPARPVKDHPRAERVAAAAGRRLDAPVRLRTVSGAPHERMPVYANAADALLVTSRHEGSPNAVKEALACNLPVVSTDVGDVADRLDGVAPSAVGRTDAELTDALVRVLRRGGRSNGRDAVRDCTVGRAAERLRAVYEEVGA
jgi:glycosyltransferase involved in cell wall biosynthesis